jgi:hypothetical protein
LCVETGLLVADEDGGTIPLDLRSVSSDRRVESQVHLNDDGRAQVHTKVMLTGYEGLAARRELESEGTDSFASGLVKRRFAEASIDSVEVSGADALDEPLFLELDWSCPGLAQPVEDLILVRVPFLTGMDTNPLRSETRLLPLEFEYPVRTTEQVGVELPDGYQVAQIPKGTELDLRLANYLVSHWKVPGKVLSKRRFEIGASSILPNHYDEMRALYAAAVAGDGERPVLRRIPARKP